MRFDLTRRVQIVNDFLLVDLELDRVEGEKIADVHREEHRHLRVGGKQQLLLLPNEQITRGIRLRPQSALEVARQRDMNAQRARAPKGSQERAPQRKVDLVAPVLR